MKKALAVLVIMMVALVSVFAETTETTTTTPQTAGLTLKQNGEGRIAWDVQYKDEQGEWKSLTNGSEMNIDLTNRGDVELRVTLNSNTAVVKKNSYSVVVEDFEIVERPESYVKNNTNSVETSFAFDEGITSGAAWSTELSDDKLSATISTVPNVRMTAPETVAQGKVSWKGNNDLVAGNYKSTVTVTITNVQ